jgi:predicted 3-demethylubiquinone-9 3-methyltransferase (glyoxalase superfamily)
MTVSFLLEEQEFCALNGGPQFTFSPAISFVVNCDSQAEIDEYWEKLSGGGGKEIQCGWLQDKFGVSWQIVPAILPELLCGDPAASNRVMREVMKMVKLDIATMRKAHDEK